MDRKRFLTPWSGHMRDWRRIDGRLFPATWESVWHLPEGDFLAVRMEILSVQSVVLKNGTSLHLALQDERQQDPVQTATRWANLIQGHLLNLGG